MALENTYRPNLEVLESNDPVLLRAELLRAFEYIAFLSAKVQELEARLNQNSHNSHRPPASDGFKKKPAIARTSDKKVGGQENHSFHTLEMVENPDVIIDHKPENCSCCGRQFHETELVLEDKHQVFDIPKPRLEVTQHQTWSVACCGLVHKGEFPKQANQLVQYGPRIKALSVSMNVDLKVPFAKISTFFSDVFACSFNPSTACSTNQSCAVRLKPVLADIKERILKVPLAHFDETGIRVNKTLNWLHVACTTCFVYLFWHPKRGKEALESEQSVIKDFKNIALHDCWSSYFAFADCGHRICLAHIVRELEALKERNSVWATTFQKLLLDLHKEREIQNKPLENRPIWEEKLQQILQQANQEEPPRVETKQKGKPKNSKGRNLYNRLLANQQYLLDFAFVEGIPFSNNEAERALRPAKIKLKVATSFRTQQGAEDYASIQSFITSLRRQKMNVYENLCRIFNNQNVTWQCA
jgi:transposase